MNSAVIVALITGGMAVIANVITALATNSHVTSELDKHNAIQDERIKNLTEAVNRHNEFASRVPKLEQRLDDDERRLDRLEAKA